MGYVKVDTGNVMLNTIGAILKAPSRRSPRSSHPEFDSVMNNRSSASLNNPSSVILSAAKDLLPIEIARNATEQRHRTAIAQPCTTAALVERRRA